MDKDLSSIQEARDLATGAWDAWQKWRTASQVEVDRVCAAMAEAGYHASERLGRLAVEETGFGVPAHKKIKNEFGSRVVWESIRDIKTVGVIRHDPERRLYEIAWPMGVVVALVPSTNPTSTAFFKILTAVKARNAIVVAPHPSAVRCTCDATTTMALAAESAGAPKGLISCMTQVSLPGTQELMTHRRTAVILATGGSAMVRAAHSTGKPAYGVGPGNVPVYVDRSADIEKAARYIVASKAFDNSTICATEQAVIADRPIAQRLADLMRAEGAYFTNPQETDLLRKALFNPDGSMNTAVVGKSADYVAGYAGFSHPARQPHPGHPADQGRQGRSPLAREADHRAGLVRGGRLGRGLRYLDRHDRNRRARAYADHLCHRREGDHGFWAGEARVPNCGQYDGHAGRDRLHHRRGAIDDAGVWRGGRRHHRRQYHRHPFDECKKAGVRDDRTAARGLRAWRASYRSIAGRSGAPGAPGAGRNFAEEESLLTHFLIQERNHHNGFRHFTHCSGNG